MYVVIPADLGNDINEYELSSNFDVFYTAVYQRNKSFAADASNLYAQMTWHLTLMEQKCICCW